MSELLPSVYVRPFPNIDDGKWQISRNGGDQPRWGAEGQELFFDNDTDDDRLQMLMVSITAEPDFSAGEPEILFVGDYNDLPIPSWDISSDGSRFLMTRFPLATESGSEQRSTSIAFVNNWFEELKRLAPADSP